MLSQHFFEKWPYDEALSWMRDAHEKIKRAPSRIIIGIGSHDHRVVTVGRDLRRGLYNEHALKFRSKALIRHIDRGGGLTAHEPGQIVLYPVLNLQFWRLTIRELVAILENSMINMIRRLGLKAHKGTKSPGIFIENTKVGFIGMRIKENISSHGLALNVLNDANIFKYFDACGQQNLKVGTLSKYASLPESLIYYMKLLAHELKRSFYNEKWLSWSN